jgi:uncharacterized protein YcbX
MSERRPSMITVTALYSYPIKGCAATSHDDQAELDERGLRWDRRWMVVDADNNFITQRSKPQLACVRPAVEADCLRVTAPALPELYVPLIAAQRGPARQVTVWKDTCAAWDEGDEAARWFSSYLQMPVRLVRMADDHFRRVDPRYAPEPAQTGFADGFPLLLASEDSLAALNDRLVARGAEAVPMLRFRPNIVVRGGGAFAEDGWSRVQIGEAAGVLLDVVKPCGRCAVTTIDQTTGLAPDPDEPLATLNIFRKQNGKAMFAQNAVHRSLGTLAVGAEVRVLAVRA